MNDEIRDNKKIKNYRISVRLESNGKKIFDVMRSIKENEKFKRIINVTYKIHIFYFLE